MVLVMSGQETAPLRVQVIATALIALGGYGLVDFVEASLNGPFHFNLGVLGLILGPGLLRMREWARVWYVRFSLLLLVALPILLLFAIAHVTGPVPFLVAGYIFVFWAYRVLVNSELREAFATWPKSSPARIGLGVPVVCVMLLLGAIGERAYAKTQEDRRNWRRVERQIQSTFGSRLEFQQPSADTHLGQLLEDFLTREEGVAWMHEADERNAWLAFDADRLAVYSITQNHSSRAKLEIWYLDPSTNLQGHSGRGYSSQLELEGVELEGDRIAIQFHASIEDSAYRTLNSVGLVPGERYVFRVGLNADGTLEARHANPLSGAECEKLDH